MRSITSSTHATMSSTSASTHPRNPNFTIIVNWKLKGFGCTKACSYCNWRASPLLPQGGQSQEVVSAFVQQCKKSFITISGGGDPLYKFEENYPALRSMVGIIKAHGFKARIITRELQHIAKLKGMVSHVSISLDDEVMQQLPMYWQQWNQAELDMDIEFSLVLPPLPAEMLQALKPQYATLHKQLGRRLVLRENFNSIFPLDPTAMSFGHRGIVFVPKALCLNSRYLSTVDCSGHYIVQDNAALADFLMGTADAFLFGGFVKHLVNPAMHLEYGDIDVIATSTDVIDHLTDRFDFKFKDLSSSDAYPRYFLGKSVRAGKTIQLLLMRSAEDARRFILNAQYEVDRVGYNRGLFFDPDIGEAAIRDAIDTKRAQLASGPRDMTLFHEDRSSIELRHKSKLIKKGFVVLK